MALCVPKINNPATVGFILLSVRSLRRAFIFREIARCLIWKKGAQH